MEDEKLFSILSYFPFLSVVIYIMKEGNDKIRFHARQGLVIFILYILSVLPIIGGVLFLAAMVLTIIGVVKTYKGERYKIPYIYDLSTKISF